MWPRKKPLPSTDIGEAREMRQEASAELAELRQQAPQVERLSRRLVARRKQNHFGDEITVTFTPRSAG